MTTINGRNCKVEVALTFAAAATFTGVTKAAPGVATKNAHGLTPGAVGYWVIRQGMIELNNQAIVVTANDANTITMGGLDTSTYSTFTTGDGDLMMVATWGLIDEAAGYSMGGAAADQLYDTRLHQSKRSNVAGLNGADDLSIDLKTPEVEGAALQFVQRAARNGTSVLIKITRGSQIVRVAYGVPSTYGEQVGVGALGTGSFSLTVPAYVLKPNA